MYSSSVTVFIVLIHSIVNFFSFLEKYEEFFIFYLPLVGVSGILELRFRFAILSDIETSKSPKE